MCVCVCVCVCEERSIMCVSEIGVCVNIVTNYDAYVKEKDG